MLPFALALMAPVFVEGMSPFRAGSSAGSSSAAELFARKAPKMSPAFIAAISKDNARFATYVLVILASVIAAISLYRIATALVSHVRMLACLNNANQRYFALPQASVGKVKRYLLEAPIFRQRHSEGVPLFSMNLWTLPTRFQSLLLVGVVAMNVALCAYGIQWHGPQKMILSHLRNRTGTLAVVNMIPLIIMAARNNPLIKALGISFDTFNLYHRWFGRIVVAEAFTHTVVEVLNIVQNMGGWKALWESLEKERLIYSGFIATIAFIVIILQASSILRHAFYETFLHLHIALVILALVGLWMHLDGLPQKHYLSAVLAIWALERFTRLCSLIYRNIGKGGTKASIEPLPGDALRVTVRLARPWTFRPGQYAFITIPSIGLWTAHPFSCAWTSSPTAHSSFSPRNSTSSTSTDPEKALVNFQTSLDPNKPASISFIIRSRKGFTQALHRKSSLHASLTLPAFLEGPYGAPPSLDSYGTLLLFAGGVGITHILPFIPAILDSYVAGTTAARRITLVWIIQSPEHLEWIRPWMTDILAMPSRREVLKILLYVTRPHNLREIKSPSATVQMYPGRPNVDALVGMECERQVGAMGVSVCGPGGLADAVRMATRNRMGERNVDFLEERFGW